MYIGQEEAVARKVVRRSRGKLQRPRVRSKITHRRPRPLIKGAADRLDYVLQAAGVLYRHYREFGLSEEKAWQSAVADFSFDYGREVAALRQERLLAMEDRE